MVVKLLMVIQQTMVVKLVMVGLFIFLLDAYDHYTGGNRGKSLLRISSGDGAVVVELFGVVELVTKEQIHYENGKNKNQMDCAMIIDLQLFVCPSLTVWDLLIKKN